MDELVMHRALAGVEPPTIPAGCEVIAGTDDHAAALAKLLSATFSPPWTTRMALRSLLHGPATQMTAIMVQHGHRIIATATIEYLPAMYTIGYIRAVAVTPRCQGRGVGSAMLRWVMLEMRSRGMQSAFLRTLEAHAPAIRIFIRLGFRPLITTLPHEQRWQQVARRLGIPANFTMAC